MRVKTSPLMESILVFKDVKILIKFYSNSRIQVGFINYSNYYYFYYEIC